LAEADESAGYIAPDGITAIGAALWGTRGLSQTHLWRNSFKKTRVFNIHAEHSAISCTGNTPPSATMVKQYPDYPWFQGFEGVSRFEGELYDCVVEGTIPPSIDGTFYRTVPDPQFPPKEGYENDVPMNGDGQIDAIRIQDGHVDFKQRYIRTQKFCIEREARRSVFGLYRNRYTDDIGVKHLVHSTGNTHVVYYNKMLLALKEDSPPYALDPDTLETLGRPSGMSGWADW
jgi:carotenoid cleavage dioxygenase-like enzyme